MALLFTNRSTFEIIESLLKHLQGGPLSKTHLMYKNNLNSTQIEQYLSIMLNAKLVESKPVGKKRVIFHITDKGRDYLATMENLYSFFQVIEKSESNHKNLNNG